MYQNWKGASYDEKTGEKISNEKKGIQQTTDK